MWQQTLPSTLIYSISLKLGGFRSKKDSVNAALEEFIRRRKAEEVIELFEKIEYHEGYDYKKMRTRE